MAQEDRHRHYWRANLRLLIPLLCIWFFVGCVLSIFLVEPLNEFKLGGFPLGFWIAQQGSIVTFIVLILVYALKMRKIDREFGASGKKDRGGEATDKEAGE